MLDTVKINHVQHISFTQSRLPDAVSVILSELLSYEHPSKAGAFRCRQGKFPKKIPAPIWTGATVSWTICSGRSSAGASGHLGFSAHGSYAAMERFLDAYGQRMEFGQIQLMVLSGRQSEGGTAPAAPDPHLDDGAPAGRAAGCPVPGGRRRASAGVAERHGCGGNVFQGGRRCNPRRFGVS